MNEPCPLCKTNTPFFGREQEHKHIICPNCGEFLVDSEAEKWLLTCEPIMSEKLAAKSREVYLTGMIYVITGRLSDSEIRVEIEEQTHYLAALLGKSDFTQCLIQNKARDAQQHDLHHQ